MNETNDYIEAIKDSIQKICQTFGEDYWLKLDKSGDYPTAFTQKLTQDGFLNVLIPEVYGGSGLGMKEACTILEEINASGGNAGTCHAQMYTMGSLLRHGNTAQKEKYLPKIASGELRLQSFGVTEPSTGTDTTQLKTLAIKTDSGWKVKGQKVWISRVQHSDLMILLARTTPLSEVNKKTHGLSAFIVNINDAVDSGKLKIQPIDSAINHHSCELFFDDMEIPHENLLGQLDDGFRIILDGMNAERILISAECIGDARYFIDKAVNYANERVVFNRAIGQNQGIQFPIARAYAAMHAARLVTYQAAELFDQQLKCAEQANMAKLLAADASWEAGDMCMQTHGGFAFSKEYHIERKFRETRLYQIAPISTNLILSYLAEHVLGLPRSF